MKKSSGCVRHSPWIFEKAKIRLWTCTSVYFSLFLTLHTSLCRVNTFSNNSGLSVEESPLLKTPCCLSFISGKNTISLALVVSLKPSLSVSCLWDRKRGLIFL